MRLPGYENAQMTWTHQCDVLFDGVDYGPELQYSSFEFTPAAVREVVTEVAGSSGVVDQTEALTGYPSYERIKATLNLAVRNTKAWVAWDNGGTKEARFLQAVNGKRCKITFKNSNSFYLYGRPVIKKYTKYGITWNIEMTIEADPFWYEIGQRELEWHIKPVVNLFDGTQVTFPEKSSSDVFCNWVDLSPLGGKWLGLRAPVGGFAIAKIPGLSESKIYAFSCRPTQGPGYYELYDSNNARIYDQSNITGTNCLYMKMISQVPIQIACTFNDPTIIDTSDGSATGVIDTLDNPITKLTGFSSAPCKMALNGEQYDIPAGSNITIYGLHIPPRTTIPVSFYSEAGGYGGLMYQRGCFSCTL